MSTFLKPGDTLLFQGDSITDADRNGTPDGLGSGYVALVRGTLQAQHPDARYRVLNRGVGGDRTVELLARWKRDCLDLKPSVLSISIGVNDVWRLLGEWNGQAYVTPADYVANYRRLLDQARGAGIERLVLMSPTAIDNEGDRQVSALLDERMEAVKSLAREYGAVYAPTREAQKRALAEAGETQWTSDGCHPTAAGHALLAAVWVAAVTQRG